MWFIIRVVFCVGLVYSLTPGAEVANEAIAMPHALVRAAAPAMRNAVEGAVATCTNAKLCLEAAQLLASTHGGAPVTSAKPGAPESDRSIADTLTAADRATPWHGTKETRGATHVRAASRPET
jgi:hypothetical protein